MNYNPSLDGVRALAVLAVVAFHTIYVPFHGGFIGVDVFFVLSGFLITSILRSEQARSGKIDLGRFYLRRAVRLIPPLALSMAGTFIVYAWFFPDVDIRPDILLSMFYLSDYGIALWGVPQFLKHTWSLSVEEHYYLIWPFVLIATRSMSDRRLFRLLAALWVAATLWKFVDAIVWGDFARTYYRFDTRAGGMILGSLLAVRQFSIQAETAEKLGKYALYILAILCAGLLWNNMTSMLAGGVMAELASAALIVSLASGHATPVSRFLAHPRLVYLGVLSYSIYLWHYGIAIVLREILDPFSAFVLTLASSVVIAAVSHRFVEKPLRAWVTSRDASKRDKAPIAATT